MPAVVAPVACVLTAADTGVAAVVAAKSPTGVAAAVPGTLSGVAPSVVAAVPRLPFLAAIVAPLAGSAATRAAMPGVVAWLWLWVEGYEACQRPLRRICSTPQAFWA